MNLEISVNDTVKTFDTTGFDAQYHAVDEIAKEVKKALWIFLKSDDPTLSITIKKQGNKSPPTLGVHVSDLMDLKEVLGG